MVTDSYVEYAFRARADISYFYKVFISLLFVVFGLYSVLFIGTWCLVPIAVGIFLFSHFAGDNKMEYEYILTNGSFDVAAIYNAKRRKEKKHFQLEQVTMVVPKDSLRISHEKFEKKYDFTSRTDSDLVVALVLEEKDNKQLILIEPDERVMSHIRSYAKNKIYDL